MRPADDNLAVTLRRQTIGGKIGLCEIAQRRADRIGYNRQLNLRDRLAR